MKVLDAEFVKNFFRHFSRAIPAPIHRLPCG